MGDTNYISYEPCILHCDDKKAQKLIQENEKKQEKLKKLELKKKMEEKFKKRRNEPFGIEKFNDRGVSSSKNHLNINFYKQDNDNLQNKFDEEEYEEDEDDLMLQIPEDRLNVIRIKTEPNFLSFQPLPDAFYDAVNSSRMYKM